MSVVLQMVGLPLVRGQSHVVIYWDKTLCRPLIINRRFREESRLQQVPSRALHAGFFLDLFFDRKDGRGMTIRKSIEFKWTAWGYIPDDRTLQVFSVLFRQSVKMAG
jgi:hypothetical protein